MALLHYRHFILFLFWLFNGTLIIITSALRLSIPAAAAADMQSHTSPSTTSLQKVPRAHHAVHIAVLCDSNNPEPTISSHAAAFTHDLPVIAAAIPAIRHSHATNFACMFSTMTRSHSYSSSYLILMNHLCTAATTTATTSTCPSVTSPACLPRIRDFLRLRCDHRRHARISGNAKRLPCIFSACDVLTPKRFTRSYGAACGGRLF